MTFMKHYDIVIGKIFGECSIWNYDTYINNSVLIYNMNNRITKVNFRHISFDNIDRLEYFKKSIEY